MAQDQGNDCLTTLHNMAGGRSVHDIMDTIYIKGQVSDDS